MQMQNSQFKPISSVLLVSKTFFRTLSLDQISCELIGGKAYGLTCIPPQWTLPFVVIEEQLYIDWKGAEDLHKRSVIRSWKSSILQACSKANIPTTSNIIIRSSGIIEGLSDRGEYYSEHGSQNDLEAMIEKCFSLFSSEKNLEDKKICLIIQQYASILSENGHLSNERRCVEEARDWHVEYSTFKSTEKINIRNWRKKIHLDDAVVLPLQCNCFPNIIVSLKFPAAFAHEKNTRIHFEWVWDGQCVYIVQADIEQVNTGINPRKIANTANDNFLHFSPKHLQPISETHSSKYSKISNVFLYNSIGLPTTKFYILNDHDTLDLIARDKMPSLLIEDLTFLVRESLVIRMDVETNELSIRQMLPRTNEVRNIDDAISWLREQCQNTEILAYNPAFIFHNFVPAYASAFVYAAPEQRKVIINALWGLPEGLYYNSYDTYIVDTGHRDLSKITQNNYTFFKTDTNKRFKRYFVAPDEKGSWGTHMLIKPYDWKETLNDSKTIHTIAHQTRMIADREQHPVSVMWLVGVDKSISSTNTLPWYHEHYDLSKIKHGSQFRKKTIFDKDFVIRTSEDFKRLESEVNKESSFVRCIRIEPHDDKLLRDKHTLKKIGEIATKIDATILLEGSTLSHAYYQLMQTKARVEAIPFTYTQTRIEYYKLVRDKIPEKISEGGEKVRKSKFSGNDLLRLLKDKLVEESFEVLDAHTREQILEELADVNEVMDTILSNIQSDRRELAARQKKKAEKAGRFENGLVLLETDNPLLSTKEDFAIHPSLIPHENPDVNTDINFIEVLEKSRSIKKWSDRRTIEPESEALLSLEIPILNDEWQVKSPQYSSKSEDGYVFRANVSGKRAGAKLNLRFSIAHLAKQLKLL